MSELITSLSSISLVLTYWIFTALIINITLTRKYNRIKTTILWGLGLIAVAVFSMLMLEIYSVLVPVIPTDSFDFIAFITDSMIVSASIIGMILVSLFAYGESFSAKFYVSSFFALAGLVFFDISVNIVKLILPVNEYFTLIYFIYQTLICFVVMLALLDITYKSVAPAIKTLIENLKGNLKDFMWASILCAVIYVFMSSYFNTQSGNIFENSQIVPRIVFLILCITMYFIIIYGVRRTIRNLQLEDELSLAKKIQVSILPDETKLDGIKGLKIAAKMIPYSEIGGDFYDVFKLDANKTAFIITDVAGKGIPAAMFMMRTKSFLKINMNVQKEAGKTLTFANGELLKNNDLCMFYTAVVGVYESKSSKFSYSCGGHFPPVLIRDGKAVQCESKREPVVGVVEHDYKEFEVVLKKGDMIFLYTDGLTDTLSKSGERYGNDRLLEFVAKETDPDKMVSDLIAEIDKFCGHGDYADDLTILAFKVE